jgi:hypothetical protein
MGWGVNLRFDLKRLSDFQLAALLERSWQRFETAKSRAKSYTLRASARGPIRHSWAYPFISILNYGLASWDMTLAFHPSISALFSLEDRAIMNMHLALCDIADITDELQRRASRRRSIRSHPVS